MGWLLRVVCLVLLLLPCLVGAQSGKGKPETAAVQHWRAALMSSHTAEAGCSTAEFPSTVWKPVPCGGRAAQAVVRRKVMPRIRPADENASGDYVLVSPTAIKSASGRLNSVENVTSTIGFGNVANEFNLQINTESTFPRKAAGSLCSGTTNTACTGWLQFVYDSGGSINIQSWAINFAPKCPANLELSGPQQSCGTRTASFTLPGPTLKLTDLAGAVLTGQVFQDNKGNVFDQVLLTVGTHAYKTNPSKDIVGAFGNWKTAEFNVFGNSGGDETVFNSGSLVAVQLNVDNGTGAGATCKGPGAGDTGESTNLTLLPCSAPNGSAIVFREGVAPIVASVAANSGSAAGGTHVTIQAGTSAPNKTPVVNGFTSHATVRFGSANALAVQCSTNTCTATSPQGNGTVDVSVANVFQDGEVGPFSAPGAADRFTYLAPGGCKLTLLGCPAGGGTQQYEVTCPATVNFLVDQQFQKSGTFFVGQEAGAHQTLGVSACTPNTNNCQLFTTTATQICPIHGGGGGGNGGTKPLPNCNVCRQRQQGCMQVPGGFQCTGSIQ